MNYDIRKLQGRLNELGFGPLVVDGIKGPRTDAAIIAYKKSIGLRARALVGPITWAALFPSVPTFHGEHSLPWMQHALHIKGLHEVRNRSKLVKWFDASVSWIDPREVPWCGAFVASALRHWQPEIAIPENPLGARNWGTFGVGCGAQLGAILTFWRGKKSGWKGHVGFYFGEDNTAFHVLGGNQSNAVTVTRIAKSRFLQARFPADFAQPRKTVMLDHRGQPLSTNEA